MKTSRFKLYIIEHVTRGCLTSIDWDGSQKRYRFRWSIARSHADVQKFFSLDNASLKDALAHVKGSYVLGLTSDGYERVQTSSALAEGDSAGDQQASAMPPR